MLQYRVYIGTQSTLLYFIFSIPLEKYDTFHLISGDIPHHPTIEELVCLGHFYKENQENYSLEI